MILSRRIPRLFFSPPKKKKRERVGGLPGISFWTLSYFFTDSDSKTRLRSYCAVDEFTFSITVGNIWCESRYLLASSTSPLRCIYSKCQLIQNKSNPLLVGRITSLIFNMTLFIGMQSFSLVWLHISWPTTLGDIEFSIRVAAVVFGPSA